MGHAVFQIQEEQLVLRRSSLEEALVDNRWITRTGLVVEGLIGQPYIHLDIRTPFGETVNDSQVMAALTESLGPRQDKYRRGGWHIQFVEDTNLGSNHRIFVDLKDAASIQESWAKRDVCLSLEVAMEALGEWVMATKGDTHFQLLYGGNGFCLSLLFVNGSPFHILRLDEGASAKTAQRLRQHREFAVSQGKITAEGMKTFITQGDPLGQFEAIAALEPQRLSLGLTGSDVPATTLMLHLGLALAARQRDLLSHNRVPEKNRSNNTIIRSRAQFMLAIGLTTLACIAIAAGMALMLQKERSQLQKLQAVASTYQGQVAAISKLKNDKSDLETYLQDLRPVWNRPMNWSALFREVSKALPAEAGMDGLTVVRKPDGHLELTFRAWVRDWDKVQGIQKSLTSSSLFSTVSLSEQRKDLANGVVVFHVTGQLERQ